MERCGSGADDLAAELICLHSPSHRGNVSPIRSRTLSRFAIAAAIMDENRFPFIGSVRGY
jgi:hypothetical protein